MQKLYFFERRNPMAKKTIYKIIIIMLIAISILIAFSQITNAYTINLDFNQAGDKSNATENVAHTIGAIINFAQVIGAGIAIIMLIVVGIQYVWASPSGRAQIAKTARYYVLGAILIFSAVTLLGFAKKFAIEHVNNAVS
jgi:hypothetical protein